jgi:hypothetical protein
MGLSQPLHLAVKVRVLGSLTRAASLQLPPKGGASSAASGVPWLFNF